MALEIITLLLLLSPRARLSWDWLLVMLLTLLPSEEDVYEESGGEGRADGSGLRDDFANGFSTFLAPLHTPSPVLLLSLPSDTLFPLHSRFPLPPGDVLPSLLLVSPSPSFPPPSSPPYGPSACSPASLPWEEAREFNEVAEREARSLAKEKEGIRNAEEGQKEKEEQGKEVAQMRAGEEGRKGSRRQNK
ncbi:hypothetical protein NGA_0556500, partial [Nannochloropsis gaditana CCMP526]|uniref:uncharacterized protein n=1 Tax=Nannochloropsis gaditana (strain CCMP526) TaxID=1093141 RepID=UPI00029F6D59